MHASGHQHGIYFVKIRIASWEILRKEQFELQFVLQFTIFFPGPWSAYRSWFPGEYGYGRLFIANVTHLSWTQVFSITGDVEDRVWIVQDNHGPFKPQPSEMKLPKFAQDIVLNFLDKGKADLENRCIKLGGNSKKVVLDIVTQSLILIVNKYY